MSKRASDSAEPPSKRWCRHESPLEFACAAQPRYLNTDISRCLSETERTDLCYPECNEPFAEPVAELFGTCPRRRLNSLYLPISKPYTLIGRTLLDRPRPEIDLNCAYDKRISHFEAALLWDVETRSARLQRFGRNTIRIRSNGKTTLLRNRLDVVPLVDGTVIHCGDTDLQFRLKAPASK